MSHILKIMLTQLYQWAMALVLATAILHLLPAAGLPLPYPLHLLVHFKLHVLALVVFGLLTYLVQRRWRKSLGYLGLALLISAPLWPYLTRQPYPTTGPAVSILHANVYLRNTDVTRIQALIHRKHPDLIHFNEYMWNWPKQMPLATFKRDYPYQVVTTDNVFLSKYPLTHVAIEPFDSVATKQGGRLFAHKTINAIRPHPCAGVSSGHAGRKSGTSLSSATCRQANGCNKPCV
jgi:hypothetical protein